MFEILFTGVNPYYPIEVGEGTLPDVLIKLLPVIAGPLLTALVKRLAKGLNNDIPPAWKTVLTSIFGALVSVLGGGDVVSGAVGGLAGGKIRDYATGKPNAVSVAEKDKLGTC